MTFCPQEGCSGPSRIKPAGNGAHTLLCCAKAVPGYSGAPAFYLSISYISTAKIAFDLGINYISTAETAFDLGISQWHLQSSAWIRTTINNRPDKRELQCDQRELQCDQRELQCDQRELQCD